jgi:preprotein translocase SecE subunit
MAKLKSGPSYWAELLKVGLYKRNQGRLSRQLTVAALGVLLFFGAYTLSSGPLSGYANSFLSMTVRYNASVQSGESPDSALVKSLDSALVELAKKHGGQLAGVKQGRRFHELTFQFPTSKGWTTRPELVSQMKKNCEKFKQAVSKHKQLGAKVRVSEPRRQRRRAVVVSVGLPVLLFVVAGWMLFRAVNYPRFADFLISVEAEMDKVSWPGRKQLYRSTAVVVSTMFFLGFVLLGFDVIWKEVFTLINFLRL